MIDAYLDGIPGNGKTFPDGAKMAKVHWNPKKNDYFPETTVPGTLHDVDFMVKDSKRFADSGGWGWAAFKYDAASDTFTPAPRLTSRRRRTTPSAGSPATRSWSQKTTSSRRMGRGERGVSPALHKTRRWPIGLPVAIRWQKLTRSRGTYSQAIDFTGRN